jgi:glyoxylase-like metal-dependent hydrolase (beta-lactamase superfamily II)
MQHRMLTTICAAALCGVAATAFAASAPLEVSVDRARAMLVKEQLGDGIYVCRERDELAKAIETGKLADGSPLTAEVRARKESFLAKGRQFIAEIEQLPRVLPNLVYREEMTFWSGLREFRLFSLTGDATASTVLYLPREKVLVTGDVLVSPEDGQGPPPWTMNSYAVSAWLDSLRRLEALDLKVIVPGQGPAMHDKVYLRRTIELFAALIAQVHAALDRGLVKLAEVQAAVNVDRIGREYTPAAAELSEDFRSVVASLAKKAMQEALDGAVDVN